MFLSFLDELRAAKIPASLKEHLTLLEALKAGVIERRVEDFYYLARSTYVKDEGLLDRFDQVFGKVFNGLETSYEAEVAEIPEEWLRKLAELYLSPEEMAEIKTLGSWEELMETLKKRLEEQKERHEGGNKWIGTAGKTRSAPMATTPRVCASARRREGTAARSRSGTSASSRTSTTRSSSAPATSRWRSAACAASRARARRTNSTSTRRSAGPPRKPISTS
jgi:uncharacterized protein with von Willebrand factor type A (vWA) domain